MSNAKRRRRGWKLPPRAILHWWDIHSWAGIGGGLILYVMFVAGATTLFHHELEVWEEPIHQRAAPQVRPLEPALAQLYRTLRAGEDPTQRPKADVAAEAAEKQATEEAAKADGADEAGVAVATAADAVAADASAGAATAPTTAEAPSLTAFWFFPPHPGRGEAATAYMDGNAKWHVAYLDRKSGELLEQRERLAHFLYGLHYLWFDLTGETLYIFAGILAVVFLLIITTGTLVHLRNLKRQFHQFRPKKSRHALWADLHKVLGVIGLPFQMMYAYTGAMIVLGPIIAPLVAGSLFDGDDKRAAAAAAGPVFENPMTSGEWLHGGAAAQHLPPPQPTISAPSAPATGLLGLPLDELVARARAKAPKMDIDAVQIVHPGYSHGYVEISGYDSANIPHGRTVVILRSATGELLTPPPELQSSASETARRWVRGLHIAHFGGFGTRILLFLLTLAGCAAIMTGNALWLVRREERAASLGNRVLAKLTAGVGAGLWVAMGVMLVASRILPWGLEHRGTIEEGLFFAALVGCVVWALATRGHTHSWWRQLVVAAALFAATPLLAALHSGSGALGGLHVPPAGAPPGAGPMHDVIGVDVALWVLALILGACAYWLRGIARRLDAAGEASATTREASSSSQAKGAPPPPDEESAEAMESEKSAEGSAT